jgi:ubiquinone biosynthesis protein UbiJ
VLPHHIEVEAFVSDLEKTRDDVERLSARINLLVKGLAK